MLSDDEREYYEWQLNVPGFGEKGQSVLRNSTALVSRVGGLGGPLAFSLAAAGFGRIILAHGGNLRKNDLNRQIMMQHAQLDRPRHVQAKDTLNRFSPTVEVVSVGENINETNVAGLIQQADIVFSCAPLFEERLLLAREAVRLKKVIVDAAMFNMEGQVLATRGGETACLGCLVPEIPHGWERRFPVIGALSAMIAQMAALEGIKLLTNMGESPLNTLLHLDATSMKMRKVQISQNPHCPFCAG